MSEPEEESALRVLLAFYEENARQARYHGSQRQAVTAAVLVGTSLTFVAAAIAGISAGFLGAFLVAAGFYGFWACLHHHERSRLHVERLHAVREAMWEKFPGGVGDLYGLANQQPRDRFPVFSEKTARIHYAWQLMHVVVLLLGLGLILA